jgi:redox-sensing transcriptional repressor
VQRLPLYLRCLDDLPAETERVSSSGLAARARVTPEQVRKDLSCLGSYGVRGVGYSVAELRHQIRQALGVAEQVAIVVVGAGNLGRALAGYGGFGESGFVIVGLFDSDPAATGSPVGDLAVEPVDRLVEATAARGVEIGVIATPADAAQDVADSLVEAGVASILNFAPTVIRVPDGVEVRRVDLATELQVLSYYRRRS